MGCLKRGKTWKMKTSNRNKKKGEGHFLKLNLALELLKNGTNKYFYLDVYVKQKTN